MLFSSFVHIYLSIGLSEKFVPMLKENLNAENLNFSTFIKLYRLNYID